MEINVNMNEINSIEQIISKILVENDFNGMNRLLSKYDTKNKFIFPSIDGNPNNGFVSVSRDSIAPYIKVIPEKDFNKIVGRTKKGLSKKSGRYQEHLYGVYIQAIKEQDEGYMSDILKKALDFQINLSYVKSLMRNKKFMREWKKNFIDETPVEIFKQKGNLKIINIVKERSL